MTKKNKISFLSVVLLLLLSSCLTTYQSEQNNNPNSNYASVYNPSSSNIQPQVRCYHISDNKTYVFFKINPANLMPEGKADSSIVRLGIHYAFRDSETRKIVDSSRITYSIRHDKPKPFVTYFPVELELGAHYFG